MVSITSKSSTGSRLRWLLLVVVVAAAAAVEVAKLLRLRAILTVTRDDLGEDDDEFMIGKQLIEVVGFHFKVNTVAIESING